MKFASNILVIASLVLMMGCASSNKTYQRGDMSSTKSGTVESVRTVTLDGRRSIVGTLTGTILGSIAGASIGNTRTSGLNAFIGGVLGSFAGGALENAITQEDGIEITVQLDNGEIVSIVQDDDVPFENGDRVQVIDGNHTAYVTH